jgi:DNA segregation ATPase FtsK/SpoIIIE-like protein
MTTDCFPHQVLSSTSGAQLDDLQQQLEAAHAAHAAELAAVEIKLSAERADFTELGNWRGGSASGAAAQLSTADEMAAAQASERVARKELDAVYEARKAAIKRALSEVAKRKAAEAVAAAVRKTVSDAEVLAHAAEARP